MKSKIRIFSALLGIILISTMIAFTSPAAAEEASFPLPAACGPPFPLDNQLVMICKPEPFNGTLIMYAHGYVSPQKPLALPFGELEAFAEPISVLLNQGFAFATSSYSKNGYAVEQAGKDLKALANYFNAKIAKTSKVLLIGASEGASVTQMLIEKYPKKFDGGLAMCGPVAGMPYQINKIGDFFVIFDYLFPWVFPKKLSLSDPVERIYEKVQRHWGDRYEDAIADAIQSHPLRTLWLFGITDTAFNWDDPRSFIGAAQLHLGRTVFGTLDMIETASGMPFDNYDRWYDASWLLNHSVERVSGDPKAEKYVKKFYQPTGNLFKPLVTMHNSNDPNVPFEHEELYEQLVDASGNGGNLTRIEIEDPGFGHCNFEPKQVLHAFDLLLMQLDHDL